MPRDSEHSASSKTTQTKRETQALTGTNVRKCGAAGPHSHWKRSSPGPRPQPAAGSHRACCGIPQPRRHCGPHSDTTKELLHVRSGANEQLQAFCLRCLRGCKGFLTSAQRLFLMIVVGLLLQPRTAVFERPQCLWRVDSSRSGSSGLEGCCRPESVHWTLDLDFLTADVRWAAYARRVKGGANDGSKRTTSRPQTGPIGRRRCRT